MDNYEDIRGVISRDSLVRGVQRIKGLRERFNLQSDLHLVVSDNQADTDRSSIDGVSDSVEMSDYLTFLAESRHAPSPDDSAVTRTNTHSQK